MKTRNIVKNGDASEGLSSWETSLVDISSGERMEVTDINEDTGEVKIELVDNPAFRLTDNPSCCMRQRLKLSRKTEGLDVSFSYLTATNNHLAHEVVVIVEYSSGNIQRHYMPMRDDYRAITEYDPFMPKKATEAGIPITDKYGEVGIYGVGVEWIYHYSYISLLPNEEVVDVRIEVVGLNETGMHALIDDIEIFSYFDRGDAGEITYVRVPEGTTEMPVFAAITDQSITDVYITPSQAIDGVENCPKLELVSKANDVHEAEEVIATLTYTDLTPSVAYELVEWGNVDKYLEIGSALTLRVVEGTMPESTLSIVWMYEAPAGGFVDEDGEFIEEGEE